MNNIPSAITRQATSPIVVRAGRVGEPNSPGFAMVPHASTAVAGMSDSAFRAWIALERWTYRGAFPSNSELAAACGWLSPADGKPAAWKAVRVLAELEKLGIVRRLTDRSDGYWKRIGLEVVRPQEWASLNGQTGMTPASYPLPRPSEGGIAPALRSSRIQELEQPIDRLSGPERGGDRPTKPVEVEAVASAAPEPRKATAKMPESEVEAKGKAIHARLYEGRSPAIAAGDWRQWERAYLGVGRDLLAGRLTADQVDQAVAIGRREDSRKRGARFLATIRALRAGRPASKASRPDPVAAVVHRSKPVRSAVKPGPDDPPLIPRLAGEPIGVYFRRIASGQS